MSFQRKQGWRVRIHEKTENDTIVRRAKKDIVSSNIWLLPPGSNFKDFFHRKRNSHGEYMFSALKFLTQTVSLVSDYLYSGDTISVDWSAALEWKLFTECPTFSMDSSIPLERIDGVQLRKGDFIGSGDSKVSSLPFLLRSNVIDLEVTSEKLLVLKVNVHQDSKTRVVINLGATELLDVTPALGTSVKQAIHSNVPIVAADRELPPSPAHGAMLIVEKEILFVRLIVEIPPVESLIQIALDENLDLVTREGAKSLALLRKEGQSEIKFLVKICVGGLERHEDRDTEELRSAVNRNSTFIIPNQSDTERRRETGNRKY